MRHGLSAWICAAVLAAGLSAAMLAGIGVAVAEDGATGGDGHPTSSNSTGVDKDSHDGAKAGDTKADTGAKVGGTKVDTRPGEGSGDAREPKVSDNDSDEKATDDDIDTKDTPGTDEDNPPTTSTVVPDKPTHQRQTDGNAPKSPTVEHAALDQHREVTPPAITEKVVATKNLGNLDELGTAAVEPKPAEHPDIETTGAAQTVSRTVTRDPVTPDVEATTFAVAAPQPAAATSTGPTLINILGTLAWSVIDFVIKLVDLPPVIPPNSSVTMGRSTLQIDCGCTGGGYTADADWYYPKEGEPDKFIYFQHGFPARAGFYDVTIRQLAEENNAIIVAPSITSNYFAADGCSLTADPMHEAVANLFIGDRAELLASARAAGYEGDLPQEFVFAGQSAGAMLAGGASGYFYDLAPDGQKADMVGVLLYDGSAANGELARALDKLPKSVPVLAIAAEPALINNFGDATKVLLEKRPGQFTGVQLVRGAHSDAFQSSAFGGLVQAFVGVTFGASTPENVEAVQVLSKGWLTDMYAQRVYLPTHTGIYGTPGQPGQVLVDIPTDAGVAQGYVLPAPVPTPSVIELFIAALIQSINSNDYITCAPGQGVTAASCSA